MSIVSGVDSTREKGLDRAGIDCTPRRAMIVVNTEMKACIVNEFVTV